MLGLFKLRVDFLSKLCFMAMLSASLRSVTEKANNV